MFTYYMTLDYDTIMFYRDGLESVINNYVIPDIERGKTTISFLYLFWNDIPVVANILQDKGYKVIIDKSQAFNPVYSPIIYHIEK